MAKPKFYITTSIAYANAAPHIGFALELLIADAVARYHRLLGHEVYFLTGTDEHGIKIFNAAKAAGKSPQAYVDEVSGLFRSLADQLQISHTDFIRTTDQQRHWPTAHKVWSELSSRGDIYMGHYQGYYCINDEAYITATEYQSGAYANKTVVELSEDNYMLRLSGYQEALDRTVGTDLVIVPEHRAKEIRNFISTGVEDISVSRQADKLPWGIPVPNDPKHVMYVWSDALTNYISALGYHDNSPAFQKFWPADVQVVGKDILRFHAVIWPSMLMGLGLPLPKKLLVHGFVNHDGEKMSKSLGNVVSTDTLIEKYGVDATRYYLLSQIPTFDDGDYSDSRMLEVYTADLANKLGNLVSRVHKLISDHGIVAVPQPDASVVDQYNTAWSDVVTEMDNLNISAAMGRLMEYIRHLNEFITEAAPWQTVKTDKQQAQNTLYYLLEGLRRVSILLYPFLPNTSDRIRKQLGFTPIDADNFNITEVTWGEIKAGHILGDSEILFPRID